MTRYARAKGSKASNERLPNDATPWHVMKQQLSEKQETTTTKTKTAKELLSEKEKLSYNNTNVNTNSWASFDDDNVKKKETHNTVPKLKHINKHKESKEIDKSTNNCNTTEAHNTVPKVKDSKKHKVPKNAEIQSEEGIDIKNDNEKTSTININNEDHTQKSYQVLSKRQKRNMRKQNKNLYDSNTTASTTEEISNNGNTFLSNSKHNDTKYPSKFNNNLTKRSNNFNNQFTNYNGKMFKQNKRKAPKIRDDKEHKRRKPDLGPMKITLNGVEIEIVKYDGFPVKKDDAERLKELRQKMVMQGIPKSEIDSAMKLERRKAEKELARAKKHVCFHCRKSGHNLSDCPDLTNEQSGTGICFKCGSTEHTHFECKVTRAPEYRYATCFICREQGHISKQCPDNPRGIYPDGGACKICGDVTHLKKDCPDLIKEKEESTITVDKITDTTLESLDTGIKENKTFVDNQNAKNKIVKF